MHFRRIVKLVVVALLQWPAACRVAGHLTSNPILIEARGVGGGGGGGDVMEINLPCTVISPKSRGGITASEYGNI